MTSAQILTYFDNTANRATRDELKQAVGLVTGEKTAIDCGCGAGSDIAFLREQGFRVIAFDNEYEAIRRCKKRFAHDACVQLFHKDFISFHYPRVRLILADASLFFCSPGDFKIVWKQITNALGSGGVFVGSFVGPDDTMAGPDYNKEAYWPDVLVMSKESVQRILDDFDIVTFNEHRSSGHTATGEAHSWHIFSVVATKH